MSAIGKVIRRPGFALAAALGFASAASAATYQAPPRPPLAGYTRETPASLSCIYQLVPTVVGCDPNSASLSQNLALGASVIVMVSRYHYANLASDLATYSAQFGLPAPNLAVVASSTAPTCSDTPQDSDYRGRASVITCFQRGTDVLEVAHAMAPNAALVLVETATPTAAVQAALVAATSQATSHAGGEVVISLLFDESGDGALESAVEGVLQPSASNANVLYFAPTGDNATIFYPGSSPNVVSVSASNIARDMENPANFGQFLSERAGQGGAGGLSAVFAAPPYQSRIANRIGNANRRALPDIVAASNSNNNIWVYNSNAQGAGWFGASGPSIAAGIAAGIANAANASTYFTSTAGLLTGMYAKMNTSAFFDVGIGVCDAYDGAFATVADRNSAQNQWDFCSGIGAPRGIAGFRP